jgi:hypothetical protein
MLAMPDMAPSLGGGGLVGWLGRPAGADFPGTQDLVRVLVLIVFAVLQFLLQLGLSHHCHCQYDRDSGHEQYHYRMAVRTWLCFCLLLGG